MFTFRTDCMMDHGSPKAAFARTGGQSINLSLLSLFKRSFGDNSLGF